MRFATKLMLVALTVALSLPLIGCGVGSTHEENKRAFRRIVKYDARQMVDDLSLFALTRRPLRTSRWIID